MKDGIVRNPEVYHAKLYAVDFLLLDVSVQNYTIVGTTETAFPSARHITERGGRASEGERSGSE